MSANDTKAIPTAAGEQHRGVGELDVGPAEGGQAGGDGADDRQLVGEAEHGDQGGGADDGD